MNKKIRAYWKQEKEKIQNMSKKEAVSYIWYYYKMHLIAIITLLGLLVYFGNIFLHPMPEEELHITFVNLYDDVSWNSEFTQNFVNTLSNAPQERSIVFDAGNFFNLAKESDYRNTYFQKTVANLEGGVTDGIICQYDNLMGIARSGRLLNLSDKKAAGFTEKYKEQFVYYETADGEQIPVGIDVTESSAWTSMEGYPEKCYLGISYNAENMERLEEFLEYLETEE